MNNYKSFPVSMTIDICILQNAVSMYCRLGFAKKKGAEVVTVDDIHSSWSSVTQMSKKYACLFI